MVSSSLILFSNFDIYWLNISEENDFADNIWNHYNQKIKVLYISQATLF